jgi:hypothetical protein
MDSGTTRQDTVFPQDQLAAISAEDIFEMDESQDLWHALPRTGCQPHWMQVFHYPILEEINLVLHSNQASSLGQPHGARQSNKIKGDP